MLVAHAYAHAGDAGQKLLQRLGDPGLDEIGIGELLAQVIINECHERAHVHADGGSPTHRSVCARALRLARYRDHRGRAGLTALAEAAVRRDF